MNQRHTENFENQDLKDSLVPLGIQQITERMEVSPLLVDQGNLTEDQSGSICCTCKIPWGQLDESGNLPVAQVDPPQGAGNGFDGFFPPYFPF